jgi:hypothetical protein
MGAIFDAEARIALLFLWSQLRERKPLRGGRPPPVLFLGRKVAYPTSPQNLGANVFSPSPSRAAAICREGSFGDMSALEKRRYLTLRQNLAHSCRAQSCGLGWLKTEIQTDPLPKFPFPFADQELNLPMTKLLDKALDTVRRLPPANPDEIARAMLSLARAGEGEAKPKNKNRPPDLRPSG